MASSMGFSSLAAQTSLLESQQDRMIQQSKSSGGSDSDAKIDKGSKEFEAMLLSTWLQQAEQSFATVPGASDDQDPGGEQMMSMGVQTLATSMAASGGIGIAKMIAKAMHAAADKTDSKTTDPASPSQSNQIGQK
jgi:Rod binding domain-containing protein